MPIEEIRKFDIPDFYKLYLCSFCVDPNYQNTPAFRILYNAYINLLLDLGELHEIYISDIVADAVTNDGERLCKFLNMKEVHTTNHDSKIFRTTLIPPTIRLKSKSGLKLLSFYQEKYEEFKALL